MRFFVSFLAFPTPERPFFFRNLMVQIHHPIRSRSPLAYCPFLIFLSFSKHHHPQLRSLAPSYLVLVHSAKPSCFQWHCCILFSSDWTTHLLALWFILSHCVKSLHRCSRSLSDPERRNRGILATLPGQYIGLLFFVACKSTGTPGMWTVEPLSRSMGI